MNIQIEELCEQFQKFYNAICQYVLTLCDFVNTCIAPFPNKRVIHLATHAKKEKSKKKEFKAN